MPRDDRALFHRRVAFAAIAIGILGLGLSLATFLQIRHDHRFGVFCESYSPGYEPKGCSAKDMAEWKALGVKPAPGSHLSEP